MWEPVVSLVVNAADVAVYGSLTDRLQGAAESLAATGRSCADLLDTARWSGQGAAAAREEVRRLAFALSALGRRCGDVAARAARQRDEVAREFAVRQACERAVLDDLGRLARAPGDLEAHVRGELERIRRHLPVTGHQLWEHLHHTLTSLLP